MGSEPVSWPPHGRAVNARNDTAEDMLALMKELADLRDSAEEGEVTRLEVILSVSRMQERAFSSLMRMVQQGAPIHPEALRALRK